MPKVDPLAGLRLWAITVEIGGREFVIPPRPAADWIAAVLTEEEIFPVMSLLNDSDYEDVKDLVLIDGAADLNDVIEASQDALEAVAGWPWWTAEILIRSAAAEWRLIFGEMTKRGLDPSRLPLGAWLSGLYAMATENLDETKRMAFDMKIDRPPAGSGIAKEDQERWAAEAFAAAIQEAGGSLTLPEGTG